MQFRLAPALVRWAHQPARYVVVAGATTCFYLAVLGAGLALHLHYLVAILIAQAVTISLAFPAYRHWVFGPGSSVTTDFLRFLSVWSTGAAAGLVVTPLLVEMAGWQPMWAQVVAIIGVAVASFLAHRYITFRPSKGRDTDDSPEQGY